MYADDFTIPAGVLASYLEIYVEMVRNIEDFYTKHIFYQELPWSLNRRNLIDCNTSSMNKSQNRIFSTLMFALIDEVVGIISNKTNQYNYTNTENLNWVTTYWQTGIQEIETA